MMQGSQRYTTFGGYHGTRLERSSCEAIQGVTVDLKHVFQLKSRSRAREGKRRDQPQKKIIGSGSGVEFYRAERKRAGIGYACHRGPPWPLAAQHGLGSAVNLLHRARDASTAVIMAARQ